MHPEPVDLPALHGPSRPDWTCVACGDPWPCATRKRQLDELFQGSAAHLMRYLTPYLADAVRELDGLSTAQVAERITGWCAGRSASRARRPGERNPGFHW